MTTWVLLRGLTRERAHWGGFAAELVSADPGARIVALDLPGAGTLWQQRCPLRVEAMVQACRFQLAQADAAPPYVLFGLSLGAMVALAWAATEPAEVEACVLVNTSLRTLSPPWQRLRWQRLPRLLALLSTRNPWRTERAILQLTSAMPAQHMSVLAEWVAVRTTRPVSTANALRQLIAAARFGLPMQPPIATLVMRSTGDTLVDPRCSLALAAALGAEVLTHADAGHDLPLDAGRWTAFSAAEWVQRLRRRASKATAPSPPSHSA